MFKGTVVSGAVVSLVCAAAVAAPLKPSQPTKRPAPLAASSYEQWQHRSRYTRFNHLSPETRALVASGQHDSRSRLPTFPQWKGSFTTDGVEYPFIMAGGNPRWGFPTYLQTAFVALSFTFDDFADDNGNPVVIDTQPIVRDILDSPNFASSRYSVGWGQFGDVVQRASFWNVMGPDWHTTLARPRVLTPVNVHVSSKYGSVQKAANGEYVGEVDFDFLYSQLQTILQLEGVRTDEFVIIVSRNVSTKDALGFHDAIDVNVDGRKGIQTYTWSSWYDVGTFPDIFADATTLTHEVSEWINDPLINNLTPNYAIPGSGTPPACQNDLEVGDAIEFLGNQMTPITIHGHVYHTQNEALVQWFSQESPSSAFKGAYSYPDTTVLTTPSALCPPSTTP